MKEYFAITLLTFIFFLIALLLHFVLYINDIEEFGYFFGTTLTTINLVRYTFSFFITLLALSIIFYINFRKERKKKK